MYCWATADVWGHSWSHTTPRPSPTPDRGLLNSDRPVCSVVIIESTRRKTGLTPVFHDTYILRNNAMYGWLTASVSVRVLSLTTPRPISSRAIEAIAFRLTMVER